MNSKISARILVLIGGGMTLKAAFDAVLGQGSYDKLAGEIYTALRGAA